MNLGKILVDQNPVPSVCFAAAPGTILHLTAAFRIATGIILMAGTSTSVFVWPGTFNPFSFYAFLFSLRRKSLDVRNACWQVFLTFFLEMGCLLSILQGRVDLFMCSRVLRGGSWNNTPNNSRVSNRNRNNPDNRNNNNGFRVARNLIYNFGQSPVAKRCRRERAH